MTRVSNWICSPGRVSGRIQPPGDKSISHRAVILGAIATGRTEVNGFLPGADCVATLAAMQTLGVGVKRPANDQLLIDGVGIDGLVGVNKPLDMGNSGTAMRLLAGLLAGMPFDTVLTGDESLSARPMGRIADPLARMGACIRTTDGHAPIHIHGKPLQAISYDMPIPSAQVKSAILLAGLLAEGKTTVIENATTRDHTERLLGWLGCSLDCENGVIELEGGQTLTGRQIDVPGDFSAAAFFIVAAAIAAEGELTISNVGVNPTRVGLLDLLSMMGADISIGPVTNQSGEPVADIIVRSSQLRGIDVPPELVPLAIDEFPVFFIAAACAHGTTRLVGAKELKVKESDRIEVMADGLLRLGIDVSTTADGLVIHGGTMHGGSVHSHGDHRIAMAFAVASVAASGDIRVNDVANVATSFPDFVAVARSVGLGIANESDRDNPGHND